MTHHVVVVDDTLPTLRLISTIVAHISDVVVHPFSSSSEALFWAKTNLADAFVLDYNMPAPDGLEMVGILRADPRYALVPLIVASADADRAVRLAALAAGANDFLARPVDPQELISRLKTLLALHDAHAQEASRVSQLEAWLRHDEWRLRQQAERLASLWRIANDIDLSEDELMQEILDQSTAAMRSGQFFTSSLSRLDGDAVVIEARAFDPDIYRLKPLVPVGTRVPLEDSMQRLALMTGTTRWWDDVALDPDASDSARIRLAGCRALIMTPFIVNRETFFLTFWSREPTTEPFSTDDGTYIELVAKFFAVRLRQSRQSDHIAFQISHDALTGLPNRVQFRSDAQSAYHTAESGAVAIIDMVGLGQINERYGHFVGDAMLVEAGATVKKWAAQSPHAGTIAARLAGDSFGVFFPGVASRAEADEALAPFAGAFKGQFRIGDYSDQKTIPLAVRFGMAWSADPKADVDELMAQAGTAIYTAKRYEPGRIEIFAPGMETEAAQRMRFTGEISAALAGDEFELFYQPHVDLISGRVTGAEALVRWRHPSRGLLLPEAFIPFAERNGMIGAISAWVIDNAIPVSASFAAIVPDFRLYLNLSALDLADLNVVARFQRASEAGMCLANVGVEITETAAMIDMGITTQIVKSLQALGVAVALDDFGAGYASFGMLKRLPVDVIKIHHSVVNEILTNLDDAAVTETLIGISRRIGAVMVGGGVETLEERTWLSEHGCDYAQGYLIAEPLPLDDFLDWLRGRAQAVQEPEPVRLER